MSEPYYGLTGRLSRQGAQLQGQLQPFTGVGDHSILRNRDLPNQHTIEAITGLEEALNGKMDADVAIPTKLSELLNDVGFITGYTETDPTVPNWAKQPSKPSYTAAEVGALPDDTDIPSKLSDLTNDVGFITDYTETDPTVPQWAKAARKPTYTAAEVGALPADTDIPEKLSDLQNDVGFITNLTSDLANYYLKIQTYTKDEVNGLISAIPKFSISVVSQLPTRDISATTIYLLVTGDETQNLYTEYIYVNNFWEKLGTQTVDLSGYATVSSLGDYLLKTDIASWAKAAQKPSYTASEVGALPLSTVIPTKTSDLTNDSGFLTGFTETDPTVPQWAKQPNKPTYTASEVGALPNTAVIPSKTSDLQNDSGFLTSFTETDPTVPAWAKAAQKPTYTAAEVGALPITGGTLTGALTLSGAPTANLHPATKKYVDDIVGNIESLLASI